MKLPGREHLLRASTMAMACFLLAACGSGQSNAGLLNETEHSDAHLWGLWQAAQQTISRSIDLNPLQRQSENVPPEILPGDARALQVSPRRLVVSPQPDVSSATLMVATGIARPDPTGLIQCPQPCNVEYAPAYSLYQVPATRYAASWEFQGNNFDVLVQYEFENHILRALGYDLRWR
jgi:hypothetical protein